MVKCVNSILNCDEKILFTGTYNINSQVNNGITTTILVQIQNNPNGYNVLVDNYYNSTDNSNPANTLLLEYNNIVSYLANSKVKIGQIQYTGLYLNNSATDETSDIFTSYEINNASGIYNGVTRVILDTNNSQRILFFISKI